MSSEFQQVSLREFLEVRLNAMETHQKKEFDGLKELLSTKFTTAMQHAENGDKQNAQAVNALTTLLKNTSDHIDRLEKADSGLAKEIRILQDESTERKGRNQLILSLLGFLGVTNLIGIIQFILDHNT